MKHRLLWPTTAWLVAWPLAAAPRVGLDLRCVAHGAGPELECLVHLARPDGRPLAGAAVTLTATMPSMPMAHHIEPATAAPTGTAGEYRARLRLEMAGDWSLQTDVSGPLRDRVVRRLRIDPCDGDRRCPVSGAEAPTSRRTRP